MYLFLFLMTDMIEKCWFWNIAKWYYDENFGHRPLAYKTHNTDQEEDLKIVEYSSIQNIEEKIENFNLFTWDIRRKNTFLGGFHLKKCYNNSIRLPILHVLSPLFIFFVIQVHRCTWWSYADKSILFWRIGGDFS